MYSILAILFGLSMVWVFSAGFVIKVIAGTCSLIGKIDTHLFNNGHYKQIYKWKSYWNELAELSNISRPMAQSGKYDRNDEKAMKIMFGPLAMLGRYLLIYFVLFLLLCELSFVLGLLVSAIYLEPIGTFVCLLISCILFVFTSFLWIFNQGLQKHTKPSENWKWLDVSISIATFGIIIYNVYESSKDQESIFYFFNFLLEMFPKSIQEKIQSTSFGGFLLLIGITVLSYSHYKVFQYFNKKYHKK